MPIQVSIIGTTGYVGLELIRLLSQHPNVIIRHLVSSGSVGETMDDLYPHCAPMDFPILESFDIGKIDSDTDVYFTSLPHGASQETIAALYETGKPIIDMSGDFRYDDPAVYEQWYGVAHEKKELLATSVYGLPELHREQIQSARLIGNPGCYTTNSILALAPLIKNEVIALETIIIDAKSGITGAGKSPSQRTHFPEANENISAYNIATHRHTSEIEQELGNIAGQSICLSFTPHLIPVNRGILSTCYATVNQSLTPEEITTMYQAMYKDEPFVSLCSYGTYPELKHVRGSNMVRIGFVLDPRTHRVIVVSCLDNLIKGAAGQAIQNMNLLFDLPETSGLPRMAWYL